MHTSTRLSSTDFQYYSSDSEKQTQISFAEFCPGYHELDRIGVVSPTLSDGVLHTGRVLLALTTAFYDVQRSKSDEFFDYPQHFAFVGADDIDAQADEDSLWSAWSWLDVWPNNKWISAPATATGMLQAVFDHQINRLLWPQNLWPSAIEEALPEYAYKMLKTRLKAVCLYGELTNLKTTIQVHGSIVVEELQGECIERLPHFDSTNVLTNGSRVDKLQQISVDEFIQRLLVR